jgi:hypothetical protein
MHAITSNGNNSRLTQHTLVPCAGPLQDMLSDANPMVVANALAAMQEIQEVSGKEVLQITPHTLFKLLAALNECTEWGQVRAVVNCGAAEQVVAAVCFGACKLTTQKAASA